jgi:hypothetical protein
MEKCREYNKDVYIVLVNFKKAFDRIKHEAIFDALDHVGIETKYVNLIKKLYKHSKIQIRMEQDSKNLDQKKGTKQGDPISPFTFQHSTRIRNEKFVLGIKRSKYIVALYCKVSVNSVRPYVPRRSSCNRYSEWCTTCRIKVLNQQQNLLLSALSGQEYKRTVVIGPKHAFSARDVRSASTRKHH